MDADDGRARSVALESRGVAGAERPGRARVRTFIAILELRLSRGGVGWRRGDGGSARGSSGAGPRRGRASASRRPRASRARLKRFRASQTETHPVDERHRVAPILRHEVSSAAEASEHPLSPRTSPARACDAPLELTPPRHPRRLGRDYSSAGLRPGLDWLGKNCDDAFIASWMHFTRRAATLPSANTIPKARPPLPPSYLYPHSSSTFFAYDRIDRLFFTASSVRPSGSTPASAIRSTRSSARSSSLSSAHFPRRRLYVVAVATTS